MSNEQGAEFDVCSLCYCGYKQREKNSSSGLFFSLFGLDGFTVKLELMHFLKVSSATNFRIPCSLLITHCSSLTVYQPLPLSSFKSASILPKPYSTEVFPSIMSVIRTPNIVTLKIIPVKKTE